MLIGGPARSSNLQVKGKALGNVFNVKTKDLTPHERFVLGYKDNRLTYACNSPRGGSITSEPTSTCHYKILRRDSYTDFSGNFQMSKPGAKELWDYLTSPTGPYRKLWEFAGQPQLFGNSEDNVAGFTLDNKVFEFPTYPLVYSFLINTRIPGEHLNHCKTFGYLVKRGFEPNLSFLLAKHVTAEKQGLMTGGYWTGSHEPLVEQSRYDGPVYIDVKRWCEGDFKEVKDQSAYASSLFSLDKAKAGAPVMQSLAWGAYATTVKTSFTSVKVIPQDQEEKMFDDFKKLIDLRYT